MLLEQFGGANGELAAAMQYSVQGLNCDDPERKDLLMDIGTEELSQLEVVGTLARMHLKPLKHDKRAAHEDPLIAIAGGGGVNLFNSVGNAWTADYLKITGELDVDLRSNIAAEARAKIVYERLINFTDDPGTIDTLQFLMTREITHMKAFTAALDSMGKPAFSIGRIPPTPGLVDQYFNDSTGTGDRGEPDARGPWNEGGDWQMVNAPAFQEFESPEAGTRQPGPNVFGLLGERAQPTPCKAMMGLIEEGKETIEEGADKEPLVADLALIAAAQRVEHYEISAYGTAKCLARQIGEVESARLLSHTLG